MLPWSRPALVAILALNSVSLDAQNVSCLQRTAFVGAMDNSGRQLSVNSDKLDARIGKQKIQITSLGAAPAERRAVLLFDVSGSMGGDREHEKWPTAVAIANQVLSSAPATLSLSMIAFSDKIFEKVDFGPTARNEIASRLQKYAAMSPVGRTPLLDTIDQAIAILTPPHPADSIYLVSDTGDNLSKGTIERVRTRLLTTGVRLHLIYIREGGILSLPRFSEEKPDAFSALALESGGWVLDVPASLGREHARVRQTVAAAIHAMLSDPLVQLQVVLPQELSKWRYWKLRVVDERGRDNKNVMLLYPHLLGPSACVSKTQP
jgi:hypothetical protein